MLQSIALRGRHVEELTAARHEGIELLKGRIRQRPGRGVHLVRKEREELRIQAVGLGELSSGSRKVADLARIRHDHGECRGGQGRDERGFITARRFEDDEARRLGAQAVDGGLMPGASFGAVHDVPSGRQATTKSAFAMSMPTKAEVDVIGPSTSQDPSWPGLADAGSRPHATVWAHDETPTTPRLSCGLGDRRMYRAVAGGWTGY